MVLPCGIYFLKHFSFYFSSRCCVRTRRFREQTGRACGAPEGLRDCPDRKATRVTLLLGRQVRMEGPDSQVVKEVSAKQIIFFFSSYLIKNGLCICKWRVCASAVLALSLSRNCTQRFVEERGAKMRYCYARATPIKVCNRSHIYELLHTSGAL